MYETLLFQEIRSIPISIIQEKVSKATGVPIIEMMFPDHYPGARKREFVSARQISMTLSMEYTKFSLASVGRHHGGRDHATVLHAVRTVKNLLDTRDIDTITNFKKSIELLKDWNSNRTDVFKKSTFKQLITQRKTLNKELNNIDEQLIAILRSKIENTNLPLIKIFIKNHVPLEIRQKVLRSYEKSHINNRIST